MVKMRGMIGREQDLIGVKMYWEDSEVVNIENLDSDGLFLLP